MTHDVMKSYLTCVKICNGYITFYYIPVIFLAQIQASHAGEIQHNGKQICIYSEIWFQIWYDDVSHERTTFQILFLHNIVKIMKQEASA